MTHKKICLRIQLFDLNHAYKCDWLLDVYDNKPPRLLMWSNSQSEEPLYFLLADDSLENAKHPQYYQTPMSPIGKL